MAQGVTMLVTQSDDLSLGHLNPFKSWMWRYACHSSTCGKMATRDTSRPWELLISQPGVCSAVANKRQK